MTYQKQVIISPSAQYLHSGSGLEWEDTWSGLRTPECRAWLAPLLAGWTSEPELNTEHYCPSLPQTSAAPENKQKEFKSHQSTVVLLNIYTTQSPSQACAAACDQQTHSGVGWVSPENPSDLPAGRCAPWGHSGGWRGGCCVDWPSLSAWGLFPGCTCLNRPPRMQSPQTHTLPYPDGYWWCHTHLVKSTSRKRGLDTSILK